jgi:predicted RND superfamily exporter protein
MNRRWKVLDELRRLEPYPVIRRFRRLILGSWVVLTLLGVVVLAANFSIDNSVGVWFPSDDPALADYEDYLGDFGAWEWTLLLLETKSIDDPAFLSDLDRFTSSLREMENVNRVLSLASVGEMRNVAGSFPATGGFPGAQEMLGLLVPGNDRRHTTVLLQTANFIHRPDNFRIELLDRIDAEARRHSTIKSYTVAGTSSVNVELNRTARRDMFVFIGLVGFLVTVLSFLLFRSWRDVAVLLAVSLSAAAITMGLIVGLGLSLNMITIMLPTVLLALSVADVVHVIHAFHQHRARDGVRPALGRVIRELWIPCLGTTLTTMAGFLSFAGSSMLPVFHLAMFSSFGIALAWILTLTVAPLLLDRLWKNGAGKSEARLAREPKWLDGFSRQLPRRAGVIALLLVAALIGLGGLNRLETDTNYVEFFRSGSNLPATYAKLQSAGVPQSQLALVLEHGTAEPPVDLPAAVHEFEDRVGELSGVRQVVSPYSVSRELMGLVSVDGTKQQVVLLTDFMSSRELSGLLDSIHDIGARTLPSDIGLEITGSPVLWIQMDQSLMQTQRRSLFIVAGVALLVLVVVFRSFSIAVVGLFTSLFPVAFILGLMGYLGVKINFATVLIAGIAVGLGVDDSIHFIFAFREKVRAGVSRQTAAHRAMMEVGSRLVLTSIILAGSFICMAVSDFMPSANFGTFTALTILAALVLDMTVLPLVLGHVSLPVSWRTRLRAVMR